MLQQRLWLRRSSRQSSGATYDRTRSTNDSVVADIVGLSRPEKRPDQTVWVVRSARPGVRRGPAAGRRERPRLVCTHMGGVASDVRRPITAALVEHLL